MHFSLTDEQQMICDTARAFASAELAPVAADMEGPKGRELLMGHLRKLSELGFMGLNIDGQYGGTEAGVVAFSLAITELAKACASTAVTVSVSNMVAEVIQAVGNDAQKNHYLPKLCGGEFAAGAFCLTESGAGSDPAGMKTRALGDGDDFLLSGSKI